jgi:hypothetical protein
VFVRVVDHAAPAKLSLQVGLVNGAEVLLVDCRIKVWIDGHSSSVRSPWSGSPAADPWLSDRLELQVSSCDAVIVPTPLAKVKQPQAKELDQPSQWAVTNDSPKGVSVDDDAMVSCGWHVSFSFPTDTGKGWRSARSSTSPCSSPSTFAKEWIHPLHRIIGLSTGREEKIIYLGVRPAGIRGAFQ